MSLRHDLVFEQIAFGTDWSSRTRFHCAGMLACSHYWQSQKWQGPGFSEKPHKNPAKGSLQHSFLSHFPPTHPAVLIPQSCVGPKNVHLQRVPRSCRCCWCMDHTSSITNLDPCGKRLPRQTLCLSLALTSRWGQVTSSHRGNRNRSDVCHLN